MASEVFKKGSNTKEIRARLADRHLFDGPFADANGAQFDNVEVVLFLVAISGFDHVLLEDQTSNQMQEALMLFSTIAKSPWFAKTALILFLNKIDLFREKIHAGVQIRAHFPEYTGPDCDDKAAATFFADKFTAVGRRPGEVSSCSSGSVCVAVHYVKRSADGMAMAESNLRALHKRYRHRSAKEDDAKRARYDCAEESQCPCPLTL